MLTTTLGLHTDFVIRPCFLVIDNEYPGSISSRKLVLETAKYNVITAYSGAEAIETFRQFPNVAGVVMNESLDSMDWPSLVTALRSIRKDVLLVLTSSRGDVSSEGLEVDHHLGNFDPSALLELLQRVAPNPLKAL